MTILNSAARLLGATFGVLFGLAMSCLLLFTAMFAAMAIFVGIGAAFIGRLALAGCIGTIHKMRNLDGGNVVAEALRGWGETAESLVEDATILVPGKEEAPEEEVAAPAPEAEAAAPAARGLLREAPAEDVDLTAVQEETEARRVKSRTATEKYAAGIHVEEDAETPVHHMTKELVQSGRPVAQVAEVRQAEAGDPPATAHGKGA